MLTPRQLVSIRQNCKLHCVRKHDQNISCMSLALRRMIRGLMLPDTQKQQATARALRLGGCTLLIKELSWWVNHRGTLLHSDSTYVLDIIYICGSHTPANATSAQQLCQNKSTKRSAVTIWDVINKQQSLNCVECVEMFLWTEKLWIK